MSSRSLLAWITFVAILGALFLAFLYAPPDAKLGDTQRIFYFHVASAWTGLLAFTVVCVAGIAYLRSATPAWDRLGLASAEVGLLFITMAVVTGSIWARFAWGTWWEWEPRLTSAFVLWLMYAATLLVRNLVEEPGRRARYAAVFGIIAFADVPIVFMSVRWWRSYHPVVVSAAGLDLEPPMVLAMVVAVVAFTLLYVLLTGERVHLARLEQELAECKRTWREEGGETRR
ncbi:MAG: cytochrome c biogenesis protein CcsA [Bacillota bacterium]|nr:cytochrome c biogenesis protein CcsA [Bacillota bacterium]